MSRGPTSLAALTRAEAPELVREIVTPEGIPLRFTIARAGDRAGAFAIDLFAIAMTITLLLVMLNAAIGSRMEGGWLQAVAILIVFLLQNFYFAFLEVRWQGATWGKRVVGIRVIDARGGQLETSAVLARNLVRELEFWLPLRFLAARSLFWPDAPQWATLLAVGWCVVFALMPLFNKDRLRIGDIIAGTRVVRQPKVVLVPDLVDETAAQAKFVPAGMAPKAAYPFTEAQLTIYGIYELQVLEGVLRSDPGNMTHFEAIRTVSEKVRQKIKYEGKVTDDEKFLRDFYAAQRAHLEQKMLFGQRREDKYSKK
jgi:uncharacterized RDD family membrane protein YckC